MWWNQSATVTWIARGYSCVAVFRILLERTITGGQTKPCVLVIPWHEEYLSIRWVSVQWSPISGHGCALLKSQVVCIPIQYNTMQASSVAFCSVSQKRWLSLYKLFTHLSGRWKFLHLFPLRCLTEICRGPADWSHAFRTVLQYPTRLGLTIVGIVPSSKVLMDTSFLSLLTSANHLAG